MTVFGKEDRPCFEGDGGYPDVVGGYWGSLEIELPDKCAVACGGFLIYLSYLHARSSQKSLKLLIILVLPLAGGETGVQLPQNYRWYRNRYSLLPELLIYLFKDFGCFIELLGFFLVPKAGKIGEIALLPG